MSLKITNLRSQLHLPGANELSHSLMEAEVIQIFRLILQIDIMGISWEI